MTIVKRENIALTKEEDCAFQTISNTLEMIVKGADDPILLDDAVDLNSMLIQFYQDYCKEKLT